VSILSTRFQTPVCRRTLSPVFTAKDATFDFPIYFSLSEKLGVLEFVVWDKDMLRKEYLGEYALPLDEWFRGNVFAYDDLDNQVRLIILKSSPQKGILTLYFFHTAILCQPHIFTRDDECDRHYAYQSWLRPPSQLNHSS
jgi:C2 domain